MKWTSIPSYMSYKIFENDLVAIRKIKVTLMLKELAYIGMCILELSKVLMYEFHYDYIKNKYGSLMIEIKNEDVYEDFGNEQEMFDFSNYSTKSKYYDNPSKFVVGKIKDETAYVAIEELVRLKRKMYS